MTLAKPSWYVGCSPRDPKKLIPELRLLLEFDGKEWTRKEQAKFAKSLSKLDSFEGEGYKKELDFTTRDRVAKMKTYGFVYMMKENDKEILHITEAGKAILSTTIPEELFFKQMLKWQYPSYQHRSPKQYPSDKFMIRPFIFTTKLVYALEGMTKAELAIFAFTTTNERDVDKITGEIREYTSQREKIFGRTKKLEFDDKYHEKLFSKAYAEFITIGKIETRESDEEETEESFLNKKMRNSYDMADALIRHLRFTPLFSIKGNRVVISGNMNNIAKWIISQPISINQDYNDVTKFYNYMGNPALPVTILDDKIKLIETIKVIIREILSIQKELSLKDKIKILNLETSSVLQLKELLFRLLNEKQRYMTLLLEKVIRKEDAQKDIIEMFNKIVEKDVIDPATHMEWNMWRALLHIDDEERIVPNFQMDMDLQPTNGAGGKKGDIEVYYKEYNLLTEVTLTYGQRQADKEIEPVWRHVGTFQRKGNGKKTFGLFIAPKIDSATPSDFFVRASHPVFYGEKVIIIPLSLSQFIDIFETTKLIKKNKSKKMMELWCLFEEEIKSGRHSDGNSWWQSFPKIITGWKEEVNSEIKS